MVKDIPKSWAPEPTVSVLRKYSFGGHEVEEVPVRISINKAFIFAGSFPFFWCYECYLFSGELNERRHLVVVLLSPRLIGNLDHRQRSLKDGIVVELGVILRNGVLQPLWLILIWWNVFFLLGLFDLLFLITAWIRIYVDIRKCWRLSYSQWGLKWWIQEA